MLTAAGLLTENAGLPLSAAALAATVGRRLETRARAGDSRRSVFALLAAYARVQLAVLLPVIVIADRGRLRPLLERLAAAPRRATASSRP